MISNLYFCILSLFYNVILLINCWKRKDNLKHSIFKLLVLTNFIGIMIGFCCFFTVLNYEQIPMINYIVSRLYLVYLLSWIILFTMYILSISSDIEYNDAKFRKIKKIMIFLFIVFALFSFILPLKFYNKNGSVYSYGQAANLIYFVSEMLTLVCLVSMFKNFKNFSAKKYSPLFIYIVGGIGVMLIQSMYPELLLMTSMEVFSTYIIYFNIENNNESVKKLEKEKK